MPASKRSTYVLSVSQLRFKEALIDTSYWHNWGCPSKLSSWGAWWLIPFKSVHCWADLKIFNKNLLHSHDFTLEIQQANGIFTSLIQSSKQKKSANITRQHRQPRHGPIARLVPSLHSASVPRPDASPDGTSEAFPGISQVQWSQAFFQAPLKVNSNKGCWQFQGVEK